MEYERICRSSVWMVEKCRNKKWNNRNKNGIISYNIVSSKDSMFRRVSKSVQTKNLIKLKKSIDLLKVRCYNKHIERM